MSEPIINALPAATRPPREASAAPAVNANAEQVGEPAVVRSVAAARGAARAWRPIDLSKDFRIGRGKSLQAVRDVSFSLYRGAVVALVGESGSGKSTVAKLLAGQERLTSGQIKLDGKPVDVRSNARTSASTRARSSTSSRTRSAR